MKKLGVIGGLGPMATALFMKMVIEMTDAERDQDHIEMIVYNCPRIPDRTGYILGETAQSPVPEMLRIGRKLEAEGAEVIAVPCITASYFYKELAAGISVPVIDILQEVCGCLEKRHIRRAGLMATSGTIAGGMFQRAFAEAGLELVLPETGAQEDIMHIIYENVKANRPVEMERFNRAAQQLKDRGAEVILLGCTELSVVEENCDIGPGYLDVMRLLAKGAVERCGRLRKEYREVSG
ncbi:MAG: amino acid racemase [Blautia sp.]|nr:amino acid racemase [Blautia sp.]